MEILVPHHPRRPIRPGSAMESSLRGRRLFVHNGRYYSAPGFVSFCFLENEKRTYDAAHRIVSVDYAATLETSRNYVDPAIALPKEWADEYRYDAKGRLTGWTRTRAGGEARVHGGRRADPGGRRPRPRPAGAAVIICPRSATRNSAWRWPSAPAPRSCTTATPRPPIGSARCGPGSRPRHPRAPPAPGEKR